MTYTLKSVDPKEAQFTAYGGALEFMYNHDPECIIHGPAETGKTMAACWKLHIIASKYPNAQIVIARKLQIDLQGSVLQTYERIIKGSPVTTYGGNVARWYDYPNGSRIWLAGLDKPGKVLSSERDIIYINQAEELNLDAWETLTTRVTGRGAVIPFPQLLGDANPGGSRHWIRQRVGLTLVQSKHTDNPTLHDPETGEITEQGVKTFTSLNKLTGVRKKRLLHGIWATAEGAVFDTFDSEIHVKIRPAQEMKLWYLAIDEGYTNPAVILLVGVDNDDRWHVEREWYKRGKLQSAVVDKALEWSKEKRVRVAAVDNSAAGLIADLLDAGVPAQGGKGRVLDGIYHLQNRLTVQGDKLPRLTFDPSCVESINDMETYAWKPEKDEPIKDFDHAPDALRYLDDTIGKNRPLPDNQPEQVSKWVDSDDGEMAGKSKRY